MEAFRQFQYDVGKDNFALVHVSLIIETSGGEQKTKPTQQVDNCLDRFQSISPISLSLSSLSLSVSLSYSQFLYHILPMSVSMYVVCLYLNFPYLLLSVFRSKSHKIYLINY